MSDAEIVATAIDYTKPVVIGLASKLKVIITRAKNRPNLSGRTGFSGTIVFSSLSEDGRDGVSLPFDISVTRGGSTVANIRGAVIVRDDSTILSTGNELQFVAREADSTDSPTAAESIFCPIRGGTTYLETLEFRGAEV